MSAKERKKRLISEFFMLFLKQKSRHRGQRFLFHPHHVNQSDAETSPRQRANQQMCRYPFGYGERCLPLILTGGDLQFSTTLNI